MLAIFAGSASAAGTVTVTYSFLGLTPAPGTWMLMGLGLLFAFFVFRKSLSLPGGRTMAAILALAALSLYPVATKAIPIGTVTASITGGSSIQVNLADDGSQQGQITNNTGSTATITNIQASSNENLVTPFGTPQCTIGMQLAPGASCYVEILVTLIG